MACHHPLWAAHTVELRRRGMPLSPLGSINGRTTSGVACQHHLWAAHRRTTSGVACQHCLWAAHTVERCRAWHDISRLCTTHCHDPLDTQEDRDPSTQPAASGRGTNSPKRPSGKGAGVQAGSGQRVRRFSRYRQFQQLQPFHQLWSFQQLQHVGRRQVPALEGLVQGLWNVGQTREQLGVPFFTT